MPNHTKSNKAQNREEFCGVPNSTDTREINVTTLVILSPSLIA